MLSTIIKAGIVFGSVSRRQFAVREDNLGVSYAAKSGPPVSTSKLAQPAYLLSVAGWPGSCRELLEQWDKEKKCPKACFIQHQQALDVLSQRESWTLQVFVAAEAASVLALFDGFAGVLFRFSFQNFLVCLQGLANFLSTITRITLDGSLRLSASQLHSRTIPRVFLIRPIQFIAYLVSISIFSNSRFLPLECASEIRNIEDVDKKRLEMVRRERPQAYNAVIWLRNNKKRFKANNY